MATGDVAKRVHAIRTVMVGFFVYQAGDRIICFDAGFSKPTAARGLRRLGIDPDSVTHVFLTHSDVDHVGGLGLFRNAEVYLSRAEEPLVTGVTARRGRTHNRPIERPYRLLDDGDLVTLAADEVRAIATPGHTPGSMSFLLNGSVLFVGDAFRLRAGKVTPPGRIFNMDRERQRESIRKLAGLDGIALACTAHTGCTDDFAGAMAGWR